MKLKVKHFQSLRERACYFVTALCCCLGNLTSAQAQTLPVGVMLCLTGNCADWGSAALKGANLALEDINSRGGVLGYKVVLHVEDTQESISGAKAADAFHKLVDVECVKFIIGPSWSPGALAIAPLIARQKELLVITPSASAEEFSRAATNIFNIRPNERLVTEALVPFAISHGWQRLAVLGSSQPAESAQGKIFVDTALRAHAIITKHVETNPESPEVRTEALQIVESKPEAVFLIAYNQMLNAIANLRAQGFKGPILTISIDEARVAAAPEALEGVYVAKAMPASAQFVSAFQSKFGNRPGLSAENGYDALVALSKSIEASRSISPAKVADALASIRFDGASGPIAFSADRSVEQMPALYRVSQGKLTAITN
ncbi:MAG: ABC transporter substrate-binding protein [Oligoflexia bacterium]|nr:ABC transporter substrate-binding protein [Oligoflexia bacterium]